MGTKRKTKVAAILPQIATRLHAKLRGPMAIICPVREEVTSFLADLPRMEVTCYQMDLYYAGQLRKSLADIGLAADVNTAADLWDLGGAFQTVIYPAPKGGERALKIDFVEQAYHILAPQGTLIVGTPFESDRFFPLLLKKVFGRVHAPDGDGISIFWATREKDKPRRRHEVTFQVKGEEGRPSLRFVSRPGVFAYGRMDDGARALLDAAVINPGDKILDVGCGCGTNGIMAALRGGPESAVTFVDSNFRALALTELNARANGVTAFSIVSSATLEEIPARSFDVALANPPYFAHASIARMFIQKSRAALKPGGRLYLVTKQPEDPASWIVEFFGSADAVETRGYTVLAARVAGGDPESRIFR